MIGIYPWEISCARHIVLSLQRLILRILLKYLSQFLLGIGYIFHTHRRLIEEKWKALSRRVRHENNILKKSILPKLMVCFGKHVICLSQNHIKLHRMVTEIQGYCNAGLMIQYFQVIWWKFSSYILSYTNLASLLSVALSYTTCAKHWSKQRLWYLSHTWPSGKGEKESVWSAGFWLQYLYLLVLCLWIYYLTLQKETKVGIEVANPLTLTQGDYPVSSRCAQCNHIVPLSGRRRPKHESERCSRTCSMRGTAIADFKGGQGEVTVKECWYF